MTWTLKSVVRFICLESCLFPLELVVCVFLCVCAIAWLLDVNSVLWFTQCYLEHLILVFSFLEMGFPCGSAGKESTCNEGSLGSIPGLGRFPGEGKGYPLQYSGWENSMDYSPWGRRFGHCWGTFTFHSLPWNRRLDAEREKEREKERERYI